MIWIKIFSDGRPEAVFSLTAAAPGDDRARVISQSAIHSGKRKRPVPDEGAMIEMAHAFHQMASVAPVV
jgi:hypothetical protein